MIKILAASAGILLVSLLPQLPSLSQAKLVVSILLIPGLLLWAPSRCLACFCIGVLWAVFAGQRMLDQQLPRALEGEDLLITGVVNTLPEDRGAFQRFEFAVEQYHNLKPNFADEQVMPKQLLLSWYGAKPLRAAETWTLRVRLSRPRGFVNSGGFDYQRWLLSRGIGATGYVQASMHNVRRGEAAGLAVLRQRESIRDWIIGGFDQQSANLLRALAIGDSAGISPEQWRTLRSTGTNHLMAISGLHIGLVAMLGYWLGLGLRALLSLRGPLRLGYYLPGFVSCLLAAYYSAMAGFALPTQRALIMVLLFNLALLSSRQGSSLRALAWAMLAVLVLDPLSGYEMGFWLSFGAVFFLLFYFQHRLPAMHPPAGSLHWFSTTARRLLIFGRAQWAIFIGLMLPLLALNQPLSLLAPVANLFAIPWVSFLVVAPLLLALLLNMVGLAFADKLMSFAGKMLLLCEQGLQRMPELLPTPSWQPVGAALAASAFLFAALAVLLLLAPRGVPGRWLGLPLLLPLLLPLAGERPPLRLTVLDVGQGLAVVVSTPSKTLVYDTGPAYSERFNAGDALIAPHLRGRGLAAMDMLLVSHGDADHAGGVQSLLAEISAGRLISGEPLPGLSAPLELCDKAQSWRWDEVSFRLIEPQRSYRSANDRSCILLLEYAGQTILLPGDIEAAVEAELLAGGQLPSGLTLLVAPHHGSATSSTAAFVERLAPAHVVYSAGYRSPYGHPHPQVQARYQAIGSQAYLTASSGQLDFIWDAQGELSISAARQARRRYWFDDF